MIFFTCDYSAGAHPRIMEALAKTNYEHTEGYFMDEHCAHAAELIKQKLGDDSVDIHFMVGGTITNQTAISAFLRPYEAAMSPSTGHICVHETGAIEATGHKVIHLECEEGKISPETVEACIREHGDEHMVKPRLLYISDTTEVGTIYTKAELEALRDVCHAHDVYFYMDGARLGSALTAEGNDLTYKDLTGLFDAFYIGGTKNGFLFGEAMVIVNPELKKDFRYMIKQNGGMFAKGRLIGIQFEEMFKDNLYLEVAADTNRLAKKLREGIEAKGYDFVSHSPSNQIFPIFPTELVDKLEKKYNFQHWGQPEGGKSAIRLVCSWTTKDEEIEEFLSDI